VLGGEGKGEVHLRREYRYTSDLRRETKEDKPATVLLPTPPLPLATATTLFTFGMPHLGGRPRRGIMGGSPCFGSPCEKRINQRKRAGKAAVLRHERIVMVQSAQGVEESARSRDDHHGIFASGLALALAMITTRLSHTATTLSLPLSRNVCPVLFFSTLLDWCSVITGHQRDLLERSPPLRRVRKAPLRLRSLCVSLSYCYCSSTRPS
jgi:hypothetical protein